MKTNLHERHRCAWVFVALAAMGLVGCLGRSPSTEFYALNGLSADTGSAATASGGLAIRVGPVQIPPYLGRPNLVRRSGENEIVYHEFHRWAGGLDREILRVVGANLSALLATERVTVYPGDAPYPLDFRVLLDVDRFEGGPGDAVHLRVRWAILPGGGGGAVATGMTSVDQTADTAQPASLVAGHNAALDVLSHDLAARLRSLPRPAATP